MKIIPVDVSASVNVIFLPKKVAKDLGIIEHDRLVLKVKNYQIICVVDLINGDKILVSKNVADKLKLDGPFDAELEVLKKPLALNYVRKKLDGKKLSEEEINEIIKAIVNDELSDVEKTYFVSACYCNGLSDDEIVNMTKAIVNNGKHITFDGIVVDKHCAGGIPGNRTTMIIVPIVAAAGLKIPKTSSRSITSPAGTADVMEVLAKVDFDVDDLKKIVNKANGCIVWGGGVNLAPADDKLIKIRQVLNLDPTGLLLVSILAKKYAVGSKYVLIDLPVGETAKMSLKEAENLADYFIKIGEMLGMKIKVIITDGSQPIGNGIGPALEAIDVLKVLMQFEDRPLDLEEKAVEMAGMIFEMVNLEKFGKKGKELAEYILKSGLAYEKMKEIIKLQQGNVFEPKQIEEKLGKFVYVYRSKKKGKIRKIDNKKIAELAKIAGNPFDKYAGIYLYKHLNDFVAFDEPLFKVYSNSELKIKEVEERIRFYENKNERIIEVK
ncbi:MAG: thymidine phosphorylase [Candidatus Woesearchaeota archaeon]